jgi:hypothetical protein
MPALLIATGAISMLDGGAHPWRVADEVGKHHQGRTVIACAHRPLERHMPDAAGPPH